MQGSIEFFLLIIGLGVCAIFVISHMPIYPLKKAYRNKIQENGVIHFTSPESAYLILKDHSLKGAISDFEKLLGPLIWTYEYNNIQEMDLKHEYLLKKKRGKDNPINFSVCLKITGLSDKAISQTYTRYGVFNDKPIVFKSDYIYPKNIEIIKEWKY